MNAAPRAVRSQFITPQIVIGLLSLATVSLWLPSYASSVTYGNEAGETAMSFEFGDDAARMSAGEDNYFLLDGDAQYMVSRTEEGWQVMEIGSMTRALDSFAAQ